MEETVKIPLLDIGAMWRRRSDTPACRRKRRLKEVGKRRVGKSAWRAEADSIESPPGNRIAVVIRLPRKSAKQILYPPVPQTDTRSRVEYTKALERLTVKELGKLTL